MDKLVLFTWPRYDLVHMLNPCFLANAPLSSNSLHFAACLLVYAGHTHTFQSLHAHMEN